MAKQEKREVRLSDEKLFAALQDALDSGRYVVVPKIESLAKFREPILRLYAAGLSSQKIADIINGSDSGYHFNHHMIRQFIAKHDPKQPQKAASLPAAAPVVRTASASALPRPASVPALPVAAKN